MFKEVKVDNFAFLDRITSGVGDVACIIKQRSTNIFITQDWFHTLWIFHKAILASTQMLFAKFPQSRILEYP